MRFGTQMHFPHVQFMLQIWHPDKHPENVEEAKAKFQEIARAYDSLMSTDEDTRIEALAQK